MAMSKEELLELEIDAAWESFCDSDPDNHAKMLEIVDPNRVRLMKLAFAHGYADGAQSVYRSLQK